jgi:hypothetical protein
LIFLGRKVIPTTLDPVPRSFRASPGHLVLNHREIQGLRNGDGKIFKEITEIIIAETRGEALNIWRNKSCE